MAADEPFRSSPISGPGFKAAVPSSSKAAAYLAHVNRALDYVDEHWNEDLSLDAVASVAGFSPYHFHRVFRAMVGEPLGRYIQRLRLERAASSLSSTPGAITAIALDCGFSGSDTFARAFKDWFGVSASQWRAGERDESKICQRSRKERQAWAVEATYSSSRANPQTWSLTMSASHSEPHTPTTANIHVEMLPPWPVAYVRHIGPYAGDSELFGRLFGQLMRWAGPRGLLARPEAKFITISHDDPAVTSPEKLRISVCLTVPESTTGEREVGVMTLPGGDYAMGHFEVPTEGIGPAWQAMMADWLPQSGYQMDDRPCFEICHNRPADHPEGLHIIDICVPVRPF